MNSNTEQYLIKPNGLAFHEVTGSSLVKIDSNGMKIFEELTIQHRFFI